ncbi:MAG: hypothetical protein KC486_22100 [Myxococcales bacterium]|nr:hypothetical protein [Myxococcales bacterium]
MAEVTAGRRWLTELALAVELVLFVVAAPLLAVAVIVGWLRGRPYGRAIRALARGPARVEGDALRVGPKGAEEVIALAELEPGTWTLVDWGRGFAAANDCGVLVELGRKGRAPARVALEYYTDAEHAVLIQPLIERGLLPEKAAFVAMTGGCAVVGVLALTVVWVVVAAILAAAFS